MPKSPPNARHCNRCPGRPLQNQCPHTKAGRQYLAAQQPPDAPDVPLGHGGTEPDSGTHCPGSVDGDILSTPNSNSTGNTSPSSVSTRRGSQGSSPNTSNESETSDEEDADSLPSMVTTPNSVGRNRLRAAGTNLKWGLVEGVKRGNETHRIIRVQPLPKPIKDSPKATRRFNHQMKAIVQRCERLAHETGCWLYISGQHATANLGFVNYASPRLRREGRQQLIEIQTSFHVLYSSLIEARRKDAMQLSLQAERAREELRQAQVELAERNALLLEKDACISQLLSQSQEHI